MTEHDRDRDAQHRAVEHWTNALEADAASARPQARGYLIVTFTRGAGVLAELRFDADGRVVPR